MEKNSSDNRNVEKIQKAHEEPLAHPSIPRKILWNPTLERETFRTVVVNYNFGKENRNCENSSKRRDNWTQMLSVVNAQQQQTPEETDTCNLRGLYQLSKEDLVNVNPKTSSTVCCRNLVNDGSRQSIKVEFYGPPPLQKADIEEHKQSELLESGLISNQSSNIVITEIPDVCCIRNYDESSTQSIKVEIFNSPTPQEHNVEDTETKYAEDNVIKTNEKNDETANDLGKIEELENLQQTSKPKLDNAKTTNKVAQVTQTTLCTHRCSTSKDPQGCDSRLDTPIEQTKQEVNHGQPVETIKSSGNKSSSTIKQRQLELHRLRVSVEQKRLKLLNLKLQRQKEEIARERYLFEKELEIKNITFKNLNDDRDG